MGNALRRRIFLGRVLGLVCVGAVAMGAFAGPDFNQDIRPILSEHCYACHGPDAEQRKAGLRLDEEAGAKGELASGGVAVASGDAKASALIARIMTPDPLDLMPPPETGKSLTEEEKAALRDWIDSGANWAKHWAFEPVRRPAVPGNGMVNPIDAFIRAALSERGLTPSAEANKRTLIRRVYYDLHGLPPTPADIDAFLKDDDPQAFEKLVDSLLASPRYGERWARHWLDVAHYADTHGYDKDKRRPNAWPYRDYVIRSLNEDKPYGEFAAEQIAGDAIDPSNPDGVIATGFIAAGPWDFVGHVELREGTKDKKIARLLDRDDMVGNVMNTFASVTIQCARCHDHKFDPIPAAEYYGLQAVFAGVERADREYGSDAESHEERMRLTKESDEIARALETMEAARAEVDTDKVQAIDDELQALRAERDGLNPSDEKSPSNGYHSAIAQAPDVEKWVEVDLGAEVRVDSIHLVPARPVDFPDTPGFGFPERFVVTLRDDAGAIVKSFDHSEASYPNPGHDAVVLEAGEASARYVRVSAVELWERTNDFVFALAEVEVVSGGKNIASEAKVSALDTIDAGLWHTRFLTDGYDSRKRLNSRGDDADAKKRRLELGREIAKLEKAREAAVDEAVGEDAATAYTALQNREKANRKAIRALPDANKVYAAAQSFSRQGNFTPPPGMRDVAVLNRGDVMQPVTAALPGALSLGEGDAVFASLPEDDEGARRRALAEWIVDPENPLTWRSIVNRVWHYHFGRGIVETPNDFGAMGAPPTHPDLLDWLASEFLANGQSLKWLHKLIVTSATYRQSSAHDAANAVIDASNRYLWRMNRTTLDAESIRDSMLALSGELDLTMYGPGFDTFAFEDDHSPRYLYDRFDVSAEESKRRSIYRFVVRSVPDPLMQTMDCADPSLSVPVRTETLTALQALAVLNNPFAVHQAARFAKHVEGVAPDLEGRIAAAYEMATARAPDAAALAALVAHGERHGLANVCRVILNSNAFMFVD